MGNLGGHKQALIEYWLGKSDESVASAVSELNAGRLTFAVNWLYYALFYAATALLYAKDKSYVKHSAVRAAFHRDFVKTGAVDKVFGKLYDELFQTRHQGDYTPLIEFDKEIISRQLKDVVELQARLKTLIL